jgi:hypothetical protein
LIVALGYEPEPADKRREILEMLSQNKITAPQAQQLLAALPGAKATDNFSRNNLTGE